MITNFLIQQWRTGALAGSKQGDAFYIKVGLNETMPSLDILKGRIIIEAGMPIPSQLNLLFCGLLIHL